VESVILARHGESVFGARGLVNGDVAVSCPLTERGVEEARALGETLAGEPIDLCATSEFERAQQTADIALAGRDVPRLVLPDLNDPRYGDFEGGPLDEYREWAWSHGSADAPPGGESRRELVERYARGYRLLLGRHEKRLLVVAHSLPIAYALGEPRPRMQMVEHASAHRLSAEELRSAVERLDAWLEAPTW
jgi:broad specificity phosphatase PhoE